MGVGERGGELLTTMMMMKRSDGMVRNGLLFWLMRLNVYAIISTSNKYKIQGREVLPSHGIVTFTPNDYILLHEEVFIMLYNERIY